MNKYIGIALFLCLLSSVNCSAGFIISSTDLFRGNLAENAVYEITQPCDLKGETIFLPSNCTLVFKQDGYLFNGTIVGDKTNIRFTTPFIGDNVILKDCKIIGKKIIRDKDVFLTISHSQTEIQTLFDLSDGVRIEFSKGVYSNIEKILINRNVEAHFNNSEIRLHWENNYVAECFFMEPWVDKQIDFFKVYDLKITGRRDGVSNAPIARRCIQLFFVSDVVLDNISINDYYGGPNEYRKDASDLFDKTRIGTCAVAIIKYDRCLINNCITRNINKEVFWCVPNNNPNNIVYFTNNTSTCTAHSGSASFFTVLDGRCVIKNNKVYNYNSSAFNAFCYDSEICYNSFYDGKRGVAIDLSEGTMYRTKGISVHNNRCYNSKGLVAAYGEEIIIKNNKWLSNIAHNTSRCTIISIYSRQQRTQDGEYIGCDNNPEQDSGSKGIVIDNNEFICYVNEDGTEVRGMRLSGDNIECSNNTMRGFNVPVIQFVDGCNFIFERNTIHESFRGNYAELLVNNGDSIEIEDNTFCQNSIIHGVECTIQILSAKGRLKYNNNQIGNNRVSLDKDYIPCYIEDYSELEQAEIYLRQEDKKDKAKLGLKLSQLKLKTNIKE